MLRQVEATHDPQAVHLKYLPALMIREHTCIGALVELQLRDMSAQGFLACTLEHHVAAGLPVERL